jgi:hypothetical protein
MPGGPRRTESAAAEAEPRPPPAGDVTSTDTHNSVGAPPPIRVPANAPFRSDVTAIGLPRSPTHCPTWVLLDPLRLTGVIKTLALATGVFAAVATSPETAIEKTRLGPVVALPHAKPNTTTNPLDTVTRTLMCI